jgi:hypothetical protein
MRLSDVRERQPKRLYLNHSTLPSLAEAATRCSNRLLDGCAYVCKFWKNRRCIAVRNSRVSGSPDAEPSTESTPHRGHIAVLSSLLVSRRPSAQSWISAGAKVSRQWKQPQLSEADNSVWLEEQ